MQQASKNILYLNFWISKENKHKLIQAHNYFEMVWFRSLHKNLFVSYKPFDMHILICSWKDY